MRLWVAVSDPVTVSNSPTLSLLAMTLHTTVFLTESQGHHVNTQFNKGFGQKKTLGDAAGFEDKSKRSRIH